MQREAMIKVLEHELITVRGLRIGPDLNVADAAVIRERELRRNIDQLEAELNVVEEEDEHDQAVNFSRQPKQPKQPKQPREGQD